MASSIYQFLSAVSTTYQISAILYIIYTLLLDFLTVYALLLAA